VACAARLLGIPVVVRAGALVENNLLNRWASAYAANCHAQADALLDSPFAERVVVTGDLFRPDRIRATMTLERALPPRRKGLPRIIFLGQIVERKGIHVLVEAMARLKGEAELLLVGGDWSAPGYAADIAARARLLGVDSWIHFENHRSDVGALLSTADVLVLPSFAEARPRTVIEAMSMGIPVVATSVGGVPSLVAHEETGLLVAAGDPGALAEALGRMVRSPALRERFGAAARRHAAEEFCAERTAEKYMRLYRSMANGERHVVAGAEYRDLEV
jgi:glycosyltransferase involved in cell wall biosynthesis